MTPFKLLVLGGTGFVGRCVCERLVERSGGGDGPITVPSRHPARAGDLWALPTGELDLTMLRPSVMFGEHDRFINRFASLQALFPIMPLAGAHAKFQPVWVEDTAAAIVACLDQRWTLGQTIECAGPQVHTLKDLVQMAGRWSGHPRPVIPLPDTLGCAQAMLLELMPGEPLMSRDNLDSMKVPNVASGTLPGLQRFGREPTAIETVMAPLLEHHMWWERLY